MPDECSNLPLANSLDTNDAPNKTARTSRRAAKPLWLTLLEPLASLKLTVVLLALSIGLVLMGTLAQWRMDSFKAVNRYFRVSVAWVEVADLIPKSFFPDASRATEAWETAQRYNGRGNLTNWLSREVASKPAAEKIPEGEVPSFPYPGGIPIGILMTLNLLAAHGLKFKVQARGQRVWWGLATVALGVAMTWWIVYKQQGEITAGISEQAQTTLWNGIAIGLAGLWALSGYGLLTYGAEQKQQRIYTAIGGLLALAAFLFVAYRLYSDQPLLDANNTRILWQLIQAEFAAIMLLVGCYLLFFKRAGVVLLHGGVLLLMFNELLVYKSHVEWQMNISETRSSWYAHDIRYPELAFERDAINEPLATKTSIEPQSGKPVHTREVITVPLARFWNVDTKKSVGRISSDELPFDFEVVQYYSNSSLRDPLPGEQLLATRGHGLSLIADEERPTTSQGIDEPTAWVKFYAKGATEPLGTLMLSTRMATLNFTDTITVPTGQETETFQVAFRFERSYKPYYIDLVEVRKDDYLGSNIPRNYSSDIVLHDLEDGLELKRHIRMNDPLRYKGETFYQSSFDDKNGPKIIQDQQTGQWRLYDALRDVGREPKTAKITTLQIVSNTGWMIPYMSCMIVLTGMVYHFLSVCARYFSRYGREGGDQRVSLWTSLWRYFLPNAKPAQDAARSVENIAAKPKKTKLRDATQFEVTTSQFDVHAEYRSPWPLVMTAVFLLSFVGYTAYRALPAKISDDKPNLRGFGELPAVFMGRVKPLDTLARNSLALISRAETFVDVHGNRQPAIKWLLDLWADFENFKHHKIYYIENPELLKKLGLARRPNHLYSYAELSAPKVQDQLEQLIRVARSKDSLKLDTLDKKALELEVRWRVGEELLFSFRGPDMSELRFDIDTPADQQGAEVRRVAMAHFREFGKLEEMTTRTPLLIPVPRENAMDPKLQAEADGLYKLGLKTVIEKVPNFPKEMRDLKLDKLWAHPVQPVGVVSFLNLYPQMNHPELPLAINPYLRQLKLLLQDYYQRDYAGFNEKLPKYRDSVMTAFAGISDSSDQKYGSNQKYAADKVPFESWYNAWNPFAIAMPFYMVAFICALAGLIFGQRVLQPATYWLLWAIFIVHTVGLVMRIYLSGHPPVTNLYSSALFIGWGMVLLSLLLEGYSRRGFGSIAAGAAGFFTLLISGGLYAQTKDWSTTGGDTMGVMQAVLDTDFWLATHVVTVALGYATTVLAGMFGGIYLLANAASWLSKLLSDQPLARFNAQAEKEIHRAIYGTICFAIVFSFVGTVLGGLWADDSWGRFWGWDPKENGALIIVLWNALVLHARWDGMLKERGVAVLSLVGGVVTGWSWFGVNELGVGLHSYGFTEGTMFKLSLFAAGSFALMFLGLVPRSAAPVAEVNVTDAKMV